jgi:hypothetical protein
MIFRIGEGAIIAVVITMLLALMVEIAIRVLGLRELEL